MIYYDTRDYHSEKFMAKVKYYKLSKSEKHSLLKDFFTAIASLETYNEVANFFKDLLQEDETVMLARRLKIADLLMEGYTYEHISLHMGVGYDTISRVNHWLNFGREGYKIAIKRLRKIERREQGKISRELKAVKPYTWSWYQKKYSRISIQDIDGMITGFQDIIKKLKRKQSLFKSSKSVEKETL